MTKVVNMQTYSRDGLLKIKLSLKCIKLKNLFAQQSRQWLIHWMPELDGNNSY